jgi:hypothetical protein
LVVPHDTLAARGFSDKGGHRSLGLQIQWEVPA